MKKVIYLILAIGFYAELNAQTVVCLNTPISISVSNSYQTSWKLRDRSNNNTVNFAGTLLFSDNFGCPWDTRVVSGGNMILIITSLISTSSSLNQYRLEFANYNWFGGYVNGGNQDFDVVGSITKPETAPVSGNPLTSNCSIALQVTNPQVGVTYTWNNGINGAASTVGTQAIYGSLLIPAVCTASSCALTPVPSSPGVPPTAFPQPQISLSSNQTACTGAEVNLDATAVVGCFPTGWNWSPNPNGPRTFTNNSGINSSATYIFNSTGSFLVNVNAVNFNNVSAVSNNVLITVLSRTSAFCRNKVLLKAPTNNDGQETVASLKTRVLIGSATLFPNPVSEVLQLKELQDYNNLRVVDQYGKVLNTQVISEGETAKSLNVSQFANGLYLIQLTNKTGEVTTKKFQVIH